MTASFGRDVVILACAVSAGVHAALAPAHLAEAAGAGLGFVAAAGLLALLAVLLTVRPRGDLPLALTLVTLGGLIASYALSVTTGLPLLHPEPEPVDGLALFTKAVEAAGVLAAATLLHPHRKGIRRWNRHAPSAHSLSS